MDTVNDTNIADQLSAAQRSKNKNRKHKRKLFLVTVAVIVILVLSLVVLQIKYKPNYAEFFSTYGLLIGVIAVLTFLLWKVKDKKLRTVFVIVAALIIGGWFYSLPSFNKKSANDTVAKIQDSTNLIHEKVERLKAKNLKDSIALANFKETQNAINTATGALCTEKDSWNIEAVKARRIAEEYKNLKANADQNSCNTQVIEIDEDTRVVYVQNEN